MSNLWRRVESKIKPWMFVLAFVILMGLGFCREAQAEVSMEIGPPMLSGEYSKGAAGSITERFDLWAVGLGVISSQEVTDRSGTHYDLRSQLFMWIERRVQLGKFELGIGPAYLNAINRANGSNFNATLLIEYRPGDHWTLSIRHFSNAGSVSPNMGQDMILVGYVF